MQLSTEIRPGRTTTADRLQGGRFSLGNAKSGLHLFGALSILGLTHNSMFFDNVESEFISLVYHQSGSPFLSRSKGPDDSLRHGIYNHFGQLMIDDQHFKKVKRDILEAAYACGYGGEKTSLVPQTQTETSGNMGAVGSEIGSGTGNRGTDNEGVNTGKAGPAPPPDARISEPSVAPVCGG